MPPRSLVSSVRVPCGAGAGTAGSPAPGRPSPQSRVPGARCPAATRSPPYLSRAQLGDVPHHQALQEADAVPPVHPRLEGARGEAVQRGPPPPRPRPPARYLQHVGHVEQRAVPPGVQVRLEVPAAVLHGQAPAGERHHPPAAGPVQRVQRRLLQPLLRGTARPGLAQHGWASPRPSAPLTGAELRWRRANAARHPARSILRPRPGSARLGTARHGTARPAGAPGTCRPPAPPPARPRPRTDERRRQRDSSLYPEPRPRNARGPGSNRARGWWRRRCGARPEGGTGGSGAKAGSESTSCSIHAGSGSTRRGSAVGQQVDVVAAVHLRKERGTAGFRQRCGDPSARVCVCPPSPPSPPGPPVLRVSAALTSKRPMRAAAWRARTTSVSAHICCTSAATFSGSGSSWKAAGAVPGGPGRPPGQSRGAAPRHGHSAHSAALPGSWETVTPSVARPRWGHPARGHKAGNELMIKDLIAPPRFGNGDARAQPSVPSRALRRAPHVPSLGPQRDVGTRGDNPRGRGRPELCPRSPWTLLTQRHLQGQRRRSRAAMVSMVTSRPNPAGQRCPPSATHLRSWGLPRPQAEDEHI